MYRGLNRPPALSSSSISSFEESNTKCSQPNNYHFVSHHSGTPLSPLSNASVSQFQNAAPGSGFNSPILASIPSIGIRQEKSAFNHQSLAASHLAGSRKYSSFDSALYSRNVKSLPTFKEHIVEENDQTLCFKESIFSSFDDAGFLSFRGVDKRSTSHHASTEDLFESSSSAAFRCWPASNNANSNISLTNMGSVDENEQYVGTRSRTQSASSSLGYHKVSNGSFSNVPEYQDEINVSSSYQGNENYSFDGGMSVASESPMQSTRSRYFTYDAPHHQSHRQRVMSADGLNMPSFGKRGGTVSSNQLQFHAHSQIYNQNESTSQNNNRPRSFSSGMTPLFSSSSSSGACYIPTLSTSKDNVTSAESNGFAGNSRAVLERGNVYISADGMNPYTHVSIQQHPTCLHCVDNYIFLMSFVSVVNAFYFILKTIRICPYPITPSGGPSFPTIIISNTTNSSNSSRNTML
jgi:hypothetical protein